LRYCNRHKFRSDIYERDNRNFESGRIGVRISRWLVAGRTLDARFTERVTHVPQQAGWILRQIEILYRIEAQLRERGAGPSLPQSLRASKTR
jgi:hypothetical protein